MPVYNKLVRDKILEIIKANGQKPTHKILTADEYAVELTKKLVEEVEEYKKDKNTDELAEKRGGFEKKIFLVEMTD